MKIKFLGVGGAFAPMAIGNSNMMLTSDSGKRLMVDFGMTAPFIYRDEWGLAFNDIDAIYLSHLHADHCGGMELFAFSRYFMGPRDVQNQLIRPKLFMNKNLMKELWDTVLRGGLESLQGRMATITEYFDAFPIADNKHFCWEGYKFTPVQTIHVRSAYKIKYSYGLLIESKDGSGKKVFLTTDTQFDTGLLEYYKRADIIFQDCETSVYKSHVHANIADLDTLDKKIKEKMWLYHYGNKVDISKMGFAGFVEKAQEFTF